MAKVNITKAGNVFTYKVLLVDDDENGIKDLTLPKDLKRGKVNIYK